MNKYLIRLDDACTTMNAVNWQRMEGILDRYNVKPMVGVIPDNKDHNQQIDPEDILFWEKVKSWAKKGWTIALHGYDHCFISNNGMMGLNPLWERSEFAGVPLEQQKEKIRKGVTVLRKHGIEPKYFFAPAHTFDENTLEALRTESNIRIISDTIATKPYRKNDFVFIPQIGGHCMEMKMSGVWTFCFHPNTMNDIDFEATERFIQSHKKNMIGFGDLDLTNLKDKNKMGELLSKVYFTMRKLKGLK